VAGILGGMEMPAWATNKKTPIERPPEQGRVRLK